ncbi:hypothetical protein EPA93_47320 [Ktedonosporobacter rubrisoli]|uniref:HAMP domain-containing protein n=1 Tax=Ktedonosporobacter rubrisoli TaxID=2509675 RepID=A0A4V0Z0G8_KTERU|nr:hypothetical protein [Ktedonosporobacter rubrisoli]QBD83171.1 hypothetical protein EPA93_47320 [Ktedonosporobacter rubrisoli]
MLHHDPTRFSGPLGPLNPRIGMSGIHTPTQETSNKQQQVSLHGIALARDPWAERYGPWLVLGFSSAFALFLIAMALLGQTPGKSFFLKSVSDILQFAGEGIGLVFCIRITLRLRKVATQLKQSYFEEESLRPASNTLRIARAEVQSAQRAYLAWLFLTIAVASYASGQAIWTSYDVRMNSADVPFPGIYDIGFVCCYPFFLIGTLLLTRRNKAAVGRMRLILDALAVIGASLAISWFFLLGPSIAGLSHAPSAGAAFLSIYFPTGDLFLVAVGAFLMFSPLSNRIQQPVFLRLCLGLFCLAVTDSLLAYYTLSSSFNTGTLQDVLWPLSMSLIGLAAIAYPNSIAQEQEREAQLSGGKPLLSTGSTRISQITTTAQTIAPFILVLTTCAILLTIVAPHGGAVLIQADIVALALILVVVVRQALTLIENNRLTMQMRGELVISRRELQVTRREADEATRTAQEKRVLEEGVVALREVHARVARGDLAARAPTIPGPLLPIAVSLNLMLDRLSSLSQRGSRYDQLSTECRAIQSAVERMGQGLPAWPNNTAIPQHNSELHSIVLGLTHLQRIQESQWRRLLSGLETISNLTRKIRESLTEVRQSSLFANLGQASFESMIMERLIRETGILDQQQKDLLGQVAQAKSRLEQSSTPPQQSELPEIPAHLRNLLTAPAQRSKPTHIPSGSYQLKRTSPSSFNGQDF